MLKEGIFFPPSSSSGCFSSRGSGPVCRLDQRHPSVREVRSDPFSFISAINNRELFVQRLTIEFCHFRLMIFLAIVMQKLGIQFLAALWEYWDSFQKQWEMTNLCLLGLCCITDFPGPHTALKGRTPVRGPGVKHLGNTPGKAVKKAATQTGGCTFASTFVCSCVRLRIGFYTYNIHLHVLSDILPVHFSQSQKSITE